MKTNSELLTELDSLVKLSRRQTIYLAFNTGMVDRLLDYLKQGETGKVDLILAGIEH